MGVYVSYLKHLWRSRDQHSVHSPFVYELLTECIYKVPKNSKTKAYNQAIQAYLEKKKVSFVSPTSDTTIIGASPTSKDITGYFVEEIHTNCKQKELWEKLVLDKKIQISIDCWSFGLIFTKKDQEKEHFVLFKNSWR